MYTIDSRRRLEFHKIPVKISKPLSFSKLLNPQYRAIKPAKKFPFFGREALETFRALKSAKCEQGAAQSSQLFFFPLWISHLIDARRRPNYDEQQVVASDKWKSFVCGNSKSSPSPPPSTPKLSLITLFIPNFIGCLLLRDNYLLLTRWKLDLPLLFHFTLLMITDIRWAVTRAALERKSWFMPFHRFCPKASPFWYGVSDLFVKIGILVS